MGGWRSAAIACTDFLQNSGKWPVSLCIPPACPPMPRAQVLQAFFEAMRRQKSSGPVATPNDFSSVYRIAAQPPPERIPAIQVILYVDGCGENHRLASADRHHEEQSEGGGIGEQAMRIKYAVVFEQAPKNWSAYVPDLPGCMTTGKTLEETEVNIREAIEGHLRTLREYGDNVPPASTVAREVEVSTAA